MAQNELPSKTFRLQLLFKRLDKGKPEFPSKIYFAVTFSRSTKKHLQYISVGSD